jgi:hypothetical protein
MDGESMLGAGGIILKVQGMAVGRLGAYEKIREAAKSFHSP